MTAYTKGPWFVVKASDYGCGDGLDICAGKSWGTAFVADPLYGNAGGKGFAASKEEAIANAYLMAAAPELLEALKAIFEDNCFSPMAGDVRAYRLSLQAIAKAEGK